MSDDPMDQPDDEEAGEFRDMIADYLRDTLAGDGGVIL